jgi:hypothetical protein
VWNENVMPGFSVAAVRVALDLAVDEESQSDASPDGEHGQPFHTAARATPTLAKRGCVGVVLNADGNSETCREGGDEVGGSPAVERVGVVDDSGAVINRPGHSDADGDRGVPGLGQHIVNELGQLGDRDLRAALGQGGS